MPKLRQPNPNKDLNRNPKVHRDFKVLEVKRFGDGGRYRVEWSAKFGGMTMTDYMMLYADDELEAFKLAMKAYGEDDERS